VSQYLKHIGYYDGSNDGSNDGSLTCNDCMLICILPMAWFKSLISCSLLIVLENSIVLDFDYSSKLWLLYKFIDSSKFTYS